MRLLRGRPPALWFGLAALVGILIALATAAPPATTFRSSVDAAGPVAIKPGTPVCSTLVALPKETTGVRVLRVPGSPLPEVASVGAGGAGPVPLSAPAIVDGGRRAVYRFPAEVTKTAALANVCFESKRQGSRLLGSGTTPTVDLVGASRGSWLEAVPLLAGRASYARSVVGWAALPLALLCLVGAWVLALRLVPRGVGAVVDGRVVRTIGVVAALMATAYAVTTPPMEVPDEMVHLQYVELLHDRQQIPRTTEVRPYAPQLDVLIRESEVSSVAFRGDRRPPWSSVDREQLATSLAKVRGEPATDTFTNASSQPPGYYALGAVATAITGGDIVDHLLVVRLLSALLTGLAAAGAVVFARAAVPSAGGLVIVGGLWFAVLPVASFIGGGVTPDAAYSAAAAWTLAAIATMLRSGVTMRRALWLAAALIAGLLSKLTFIPLLAAVAAGAVLIVVREVRAGRGRAVVRPLVVSLGAVLALGLPFMVWAKLSGRGIVFGPAGTPIAPIHPRELLAYIFELYVGQVGPIADRIQGSGPHIWIDGLVGRLGWLDYNLSASWNKAFELFWFALIGLALFGVYRAVRRRGVAAVLEFGLWVLAIVPLLFVIAKSGLEARFAGNTGFEQARYLLPLASIGVAGVGLALRQLPRRVHPWAAAALVTIALLQGTTLWFMTVGRYFA